jgi:hypothetical protein
MLPLGVTEPALSVLDGKRVQRLQSTYRYGAGYLDAACFGQTPNELETGEKVLTDV